MGKFSDVFFASDYDHTLTGSDNVLRQKNLDAIRYFMSEGGIFTVASGRSIPLFRKRAALVPTNAPCILYNGAACYDYPGGKLLYAHPMTDFAMEIVRAVQAFDPTLYVEIQSRDTHYVFGYSPMREAFLRGEGFTPDFVTEAPPKPWIKVVVCCVTEASPTFSVEQAAYVQKVQTFLENFCAGRCYVARSMPYLIEIGDLNSSKGIAARDLAREYGRSVLACAGDAPNDASMLTEADFAFSPADRDPALKVDGLIDTVPCDDGSVADAIEKLEKLICH